MSNNTNPTNTSACSPFLPLLLVMASVLILVAAQLWTSLFRERPALQRQEAQLVQVVNQAGVLQNIRNGLCENLMELSKTDRDAKEVVQKLGIRFSPPAGLPQGLPEPTPAPK